MHEAINISDMVADLYSHLAPIEASEFIEVALLNRVLVKANEGKSDVAIATATCVLDRVSRTQQGKGIRSLLIRAFSHINAGERSSGIRDIAGALEILSKSDSGLGISIRWLIRYTVLLGNARVLELIKASSASVLFLPLATALEQELGQEPRVSIEAAKVARDIRRDLKVMKNRIRSVNRDSDRKV